ncbi:hypothetical protein NUW54_g11769 [Trametes sanguinea]|uniref:Uncharacterized protein n=1 Tax=Trametes sanguinea TaxID=158606 RepID=A0ACC1N8U7_9APHY|nr:hypothetical protein NUW54_g11769 [Trametes sanguinea]
MSTPSALAATALQVIIDDIQEDEWARMAHYARLIRSYIGDREVIDGLCASVLLQKLAGQPLLPRLRRLEWRLPFDQSAALAFFLSPMLRSVYLDLLEGGTARFIHDQHVNPTASEYAYGTALHMIHSRAPNVENVQMWTSGFPCAIDRLTAFRKLQSLKLELVGKPNLVLQTASTLPELKKLSIFFAKAPQGQPGPPLEEACLPALQSMKLSGAGHVVVSFVSAVRAPQLRVVRLSFMAIEQLWTDCVERVVSGFGETLREVDFDVEDAYDNPEPYSFHRWFSPLYRLRRLNQVAIGAMFETPFIISTQDIANMASAWPGLRSLLIPAVEDNPSPSFSITALESLAEKCPRLQLLAIPVPDPAPLNSENEREVPLEHTNMQEIRLSAGHWEAGVHDKCMAYLKKLFPNADMWNLDDEFDFEEEE